MSLSTLGLSSVADGAAVRGIIPYQIISYTNSSKSPYPGRSGGATASTQVSFVLPIDFSNMTKLTAVIIPNGTNATADIDLIMNSHLTGELFTLNSVTDTTTTYNYTDDTGFEISAIALFDTLPTAAKAPGSRIGIEFDHNSIGNSMVYTSMEIEYSRD